MARTLFLLSFLGVCLVGTGCRTLEGVGSDIDRGLRDTQQDLQHGIRGSPDEEPGQPAAVQQPAASQQPPAPQQPPTPQPQPAAPQPQPAAPQPQPISAPLWQ